MKTLIPTLLIAFTASAAHGEQTLDFPTVWNSVQAHSHVQKASQINVEVSKKQLKRASRHWLPSVYIQGTTFQTNDPGKSFFGNLQQRQIESSDFNPSQLNHPGTSNYTQSTLGVSLPLYEGGMRTAHVDLLKSSVEKTGFQQKLNQLEMYAHSATAYGAISVLQAQQGKLIELKTRLLKFIKRYRLGNKANPVGYSGLLGAKSLLNQVNGLLDQAQAQESAYLYALEQTGKIPNDWKPKSVEPESFVATYLQSPKMAVSSSYKSKMIQMDAQQALHAATMEKAKFLPHVGLFAEKSQFSGSRDTAQGDTVGLFIKWNLFNPNQYGSHSEAKAKATMANTWAKATAQREKIETIGLSQKTESIKKNLTLLNASEKLMSEQVKVARTLYKNGSMTPLQFVEVLNRQKDLIQFQTDAKVQYIQAASQLITKHNFKIPVNKTGGAQ